MKRPAVKKRLSKRLDDTSLIRRLAGPLPLASPEGAARAADWLADIEASTAGKALPALRAEHPAFANLLASIAATAPYLWDLIRADPARLHRLATGDPDRALASLLAQAQRSAGAAPSQDACATLHEIGSRASHCACRHRRDLAG